MPCLSCVTPQFCGSASYSSGLKLEIKGIPVDILTGFGVCPYPKKSCKKNKQKSSNCEFVFIIKTIKNNVYNYNKKRI